MENFPESFPHHGKLFSTPWKTLGILAAMKKPPAQPEAPPADLDAFARFQADLVRLVARVEGAAP
jgi:hypothetical protein